MWHLSIVSALMVTSFHLAASLQAEQESGCICVPYYECQKLNVVRGRMILPEKYIPCEGAIEVCCDPAHIGDKEKTTMTRSGWQHDGCGKPSFVFNSSQESSNNFGTAEFGEFPWMVTIFEPQGINGNDNVVDVPLCGGALIRPNAVLTAARCVNGKTAKQLKIRAGEQSIETSNDVKPYQEVAVNKFMIHENFQLESNLNNYAILFLSNSVIFTENVDLVCLPEANHQFNGSHCVTSRWGDRSKGRLWRAELSVIGHGECEKIFGNWIHESFTCALGAVTKGPGQILQSDGGSPLACPLQDYPFRHVLAGIVLLKSTLNNQQQIEIYANVSTARTWINHKITEYNNWPY